MIRKLFLKFTETLKLIIMKKLLMLFVTALCPYMYMAAETLQSPDLDSKEIDLEKITLNPGTGGQSIPRSVYFLAAYYDSETGIVDVIHDGLGETSIYILDASGQIVEQANIYSFDYSTETVVLPISIGVYSIIIDSEVVYAYGTVTVK